MDSQKEENIDQEKSFFHKLREGTASRINVMKSQLEHTDKLLVVTTLASAGVGLLIVAGQRNIYFSRILRNVNEYHLSLSGVTIAGVAWVLYTYKTS